jgi:hypothetical protein
MFFDRITRGIYLFIGLIMLYNLSRLLLHYRYIFLNNLYCLYHFQRCYYDLLINCHFLDWGNVLYFSTWSPDKLWSH